MKLTVIICTHNPRQDYLRRTLDALKAQTLPKDQWELLLVDNASKEVLSEKWDLTWHPSARHIREDELGLTSARLRGIREASGELLVFVDDDNVLDAGYLGITIELMAKHPNLGCIGAGRIVPEFEEKPSDELLPYTGMLALREVEAPEWSNMPQDRKVPWGAGLVLRASVAERHHSIVSRCPVSRSLDRSGQSLNSCGDDEFSWTAASMGFGKGIFPELFVLHLIGKHRVSQEYLIRIAEGHAFSQAVLRWVHLNELPSPPKPPKSLDVFRFLMTGRISAYFSTGSRWWTQRRMDKTSREFSRSWTEGTKRAAGFISTVHRQAASTYAANLYSKDQTTRTRQSICLSKNIIKK